MATHHVTSANWNDPAFWKALSLQPGDRLDLSRLDPGILAVFDAGNVTLTLSQQETVFAIGVATGGGADCVLDWIAAADFAAIAGAAVAERSATDRHSPAAEDRPGGVLSLPEIETILPSFLSGTLIRTTRGDVVVEDLRAGDAVLTRDHGFQVVHWVGQRCACAQEHATEPELWPVEIAPSALGAHQPSLPLRVAPDQRVLLHGFGSDLLYGAKDVLIAAAHLLQWDNVRHVPFHDVRYVHLLFAQEETVLVNGAWAECFRPRTLSAARLAGLDPALRARLLAEVPLLCPDPAEGGAVAGREVLRSDPGAIGNTASGPAPT